MEKFKHLQKIKELYQKDENIIQYLKKISKNESNNIEDILISYDFQSGSYIKSFSENQEIKNKYCNGLAKIIDKIDGIESILEVGVGEATTLNTLLKNLKNLPDNIFGFDISWSRLKFAKEFLKDFGINNVNLFTANLFDIPLLDNSIDVIYTSHSIEPNGGKEEEALKELYRVTKKYLILLEPSFEFGNDKAKLRMKEHGYITNLYGTAKNLGYKIIEHKLFEFSDDKINPTGLMIIEKKIDEYNKPNLVCPISHTELINYNENILYSKDSFLAYPVIDNIPCLLKENSILASHLLTNYQDYKKQHNIILNDI
ncbi:MAG: methyltransferase domain-containing protein [Candidatus Sericytochromatia bacterium]|nr:methyltransferase domain-containing protein [Candidatus Sericytochromatia bacterium]